MFSKRCNELLLLFGVYILQCSALLKNQTLVAVLKANGSISIQPKLYIAKPNETIAGRAKYIHSINETGWSFLEIRTSPKAKDPDQAYAAGFLEGVLTADLIYYHWRNNMKDNNCVKDPQMCPKLTEHITNNKEWIESSLNASDPYWYQVGLYLKQLDGLHDGYMHGKSKDTPSLSLNDIYLLNAMDDISDLISALEPTQAKLKVLGSGSCSALVKLLPGNKDLLVSHVTWSGYESMLRIQKRYNLRYRTSSISKNLIPGFDMSFSSFPGGIQSGDDYYLISSGLVTMETTIGNYNNSLWSNIRPIGQVLEFVRAMVANRLAYGPADWVKIFKRYNSGTYNNQWMIINYFAFKSGGPTPSHDLLHILEQLPGYVESDDLTEHLINRTYWASYNVPSFPFIFNVSGNYDMQLRYGDWFSYKNTPRARIFARDHVKIHCDKCMLHVMRSNDYKHDPESACDCNPPYSAENAISARCDLNPANGTYPFAALGHRSHGSTDVKITTSQLFQNLQFKAIAGPTQGTNNTLGPFCWSKSDFSHSVPHEGHPDCFDFSPITHQWSL
ncbi:putative phospholipase B-like 2 [Daktulosphaira vitifoliae]|uniref:putative phospholipase B-like 2 n=1 Tax=Daktulosphaira vitifoliae TaxID=58002 RepID=UPI0021A99883|nr:putative phospholipase B-like 2 [Daktulosphaira vitifoliae]